MRSIILDFFRWSLNDSRQLLTTPYSNILSPVAHVFNYALVLAYNVVRLLFSLAVAVSKASAGLMCLCLGVLIWPLLPVGLGLIVSGAFGALGGALNSAASIITAPIFLVVGLFSRCIASCFGGNKPAYVASSDRPPSSGQGTGLAGGSPYTTPGLSWVAEQQRASDPTPSEDPHQPGRGKTGTQPRPPGGLGMGVLEPDEPSYESGGASYHR